MFSIPSELRITKEKVRTENDRGRVDRTERSIRFLAKIYCVDCF